MGEGLDYTKSFIEDQFPVAKLSVESYRERKAGRSQTLTGLGKWWGRKPLILVRAALLGILLPVSDDKAKDREIFLRLLTMDEDGLALRWRQANGDKPYQPIEGGTYEQQSYDYASSSEMDEGSPQRFPRPEEVDGPSEESWEVINEHLGTTAHSLPELVAQLGEKRYGHTPKVGDCFAGGGSNVFEPARLGCEVYGSDLNPLAGVLTWADLNILSSSEEEMAQLRAFQEDVFDAVCRKIDALGVEYNELGHAAKYYLYCSETVCPECGYRVPMLPSLIVSKKEKICVELVEQEEKTFAFKLVQLRPLKTLALSERAFLRSELLRLAIINPTEEATGEYIYYCTEPEKGASFGIAPLPKELVVRRQWGPYLELAGAKDSSFTLRLARSDAYTKSDSQATVQGGSLVCPHCGRATSIRALRGGDKCCNLRKWEKNDFEPRKEDLYQERLYAIKYVNVCNPGKTYDGLRKKPGGADKPFGTSYYRAPNAEDLAREQQVESYVAEHFAAWQQAGYIPSSEIYEGYNTSQLIREKGWKYWHQLFNPRQLLLLGLLGQAVAERATTRKEIVLGMLGRNKIADYNSQLVRWSSAGEKAQNTFYNQALNTLDNPACRTTFSTYEIWSVYFKTMSMNTKRNISLSNAANVQYTCDIWLTDPPYADAVNYHELSEFFLAWDKSLIARAFPDWYTDSKRVLAIRGTGAEFNTSMVEVYRTLAEHMPENGTQIVMFTHQDTKVWAELAMILWSAGLQVVAAWCIATETESGGLKNGNYVKGTVLMVLRRRQGEEIAFEHDLYEDIKDEVEEQIDSMRDMDNGQQPDFTDGDYLLAAYVAALKVITSYADIHGINVQYELEQARASGEESKVTKIINKARKVAYDYLVPEGIAHQVWRTLTSAERFYLKGLAMEKGSP